MPLQSLERSKSVSVLEMGPLTELKPALKWAGGKRWLVPYLKNLWQPHRSRRLVEPFVGGLAVSLGLQPSEVLLNDANPHLINFYHWLQRGLKITLPMRNSRTLFNAHRQHFNTLIATNDVNSSTAAALFYYLNRTGFNGLCRFNSAGFFNVPFGAYNTINYTKDFSAYQDVFDEWKFTTGDFERLDLEPADFIYADPPYDVEFTKYSKDAFTWDDQIRLANWLAEHPGPVVISNQATDRIVTLYKSLEFRLEFLKAPRRISCDGNRTPALEVIAFKNI